MISPIAIALALAFWAPYNHGQPVCPNGVQVVYEHNGLDIPTAWVANEDAWAGVCRFHVQPALGDQQVPYQCMIVAHELGHAAMGLPDRPFGGKWDIMNGPNFVPRQCYPPKKKHRVRSLWMRHYTYPRAGGHRPDAWPGKHNAPRP